MELHRHVRRMPTAREPAASHFRKFGAAAAVRCPEIGETPCRFEIYRADEVRTSSTRFVGGDWHWRLSDDEGLILLDTGGYSSEGECLSAIAILREKAGFARLSRSL